MSIAKNSNLNFFKIMLTKITNIYEYTEPDAEILN